jgi:NAD(P)-dependent dehydrogenase (short-subunit alcohol dehydrogenase family)
MYTFAGKVALVTGATSGIGRATAVAFAREGAKVVVAGRREPEGEQTICLVREVGGEGLFIKTDVTVEAEVEALIQRTTATYGRLDCAFNNAGTIALSPLVAETAADFRLVMDTNVKGVFFCLKHEISLMLTTGGGAIVNSSSLAGRAGSRDRSLYSASKHAVIGLTKSIALEVARRGVRVNAICPAAIEGAMDKLFMDYFGMTKEQMAAAVPLGRMGMPEDIAAAVLFLCSDHAGFITGSCLAVDGGYSAQ